MDNILVVGGAGYIGSHMCKRLAESGFKPIVLDSLVRGHRQAVKWGPLYQGSASDSSLLARIFSDHHISAVMHFAAFAYVGESVQNPAAYYRNNVSETVCLLDAMIEYEVRRFIFSSTCAVYGEPIELPIAEDHPLHPVNPYGRSKRMVEEVLADYRSAYGLNYISLRYFNAAGADPEGEIGEDHRPETHLIPLIFEVALKKREAVGIFGNDYPTEDGTCVRDYIHVEDLSRAHLIALNRLFSSDSGGVYNLGNGTGYSVKEVIEAARRITKKPIAADVSVRRAGDPGVLVASSRKAKTELGWEPLFPDLASILETAWRWHQSHPMGYGP